MRGRLSRPGLGSTLACALLAACVPPASVRPPDAIALQAGRPFPQPERCDRITAAAGIPWRGLFRGYREYGVDNVREVRRSGCFGDERACRDWLYYMQTDYREGPVIAECRPLGV